MTAAQLCLESLLSRTSKISIKTKLIYSSFNHPTVIYTRPVLYHQLSELVRKSLSTQELLSKTPWFVLITVMAHPLGTLPLRYYNRAQPKRHRLIILSEIIEGMIVQERILTDNTESLLGVAR
ncbi:hypothetical protein J6590_054902 [Homalodisca vitripennis]|nr:hypothetical protein J6590_054902 [Homalodisca vitripennis]